MLAETLRWRQHSRGEDMNVARFKLVDRVLGYSAAPPQILCFTRVPNCEDELFEGHFPGLPIFPGNLMLEFMAQSSGLMLLRHTEGRKISVLAGVERARFRMPVAPGSDLICQSTLVYENGPMSRCETELRCDDKIVSSAEIKLSLSVPPNALVGGHFAALAETIGLYVADASPQFPRKF
jgi:3-hydroxyacyl-[acyl-carrier-protein] dehydratase